MLFLGFFSSACLSADTQSGLLDDPPKVAPPASGKSDPNLVLPSLPTGKDDAGTFVPPVSTEGSTEPRKAPALDKVKRSFGLGWFRKKGYVDFVEPRVSFVKRADQTSDVIEYSWRPMQIYNMPHKERIDLIRFSLNRYFFLGSDKKIFYGGGLGGNVVLFSNKLKDWANQRKFSVKDGVNGLGRVFCGYKIRDYEFMGELYPIVLRFDAVFSPPYRFGGPLGDAGEKLKLTEVTFGIAFSIE